jgi:hypothetical protein
MTAERPTARRPSSHAASCTLSIRGYFPDRVAGEQRTNGTAGERRPFLRVGNTRAPRRFTRRPRVQAAARLRLQS